MFDREVALYQRLQERGVQVTFVTYGDSRDLKYTERLPGINILCNRWKKLPHPMYERLLPLLHAPFLRRCDIVKTNQTLGSEPALRSARFWGKPPLFALPQAKHGTLTLFLSGVWYPRKTSRRC